MTRAQHQEAELQPERPVVAAPVKDAAPKKLDADEAWTTVKTALGGTRVVDLPRFVAALESETLQIVAKRLRDLVSVVTGAEMLEIGERVGAKLPAALEAALDVEIGELTPAQLQDVLSRDQYSREMVDVGTLGPDLFAKVKKRFAGASLLSALPRLASRMMYISTHPGFVEWLVTTTPSPVVAELMSRYGDLSFAGTMNGDPKLWAWVADVRMGVASEPLWQMHYGCKHPPAKQALANKLGPTAKLEQADREKFHKEHAADPGTVMAMGTATRDEIFDAVANAGGLQSVADRAALMKELARLHATADDILAATFKAGIASGPALELLLAAKDVKLEHIVTFIGSSEATKLLGNARLLREVRKRVPTLRFGDIADYKAHHQTLVDNEPLRQWFLESASPPQLLWFATSDASKGRATIRFISQRFPTWEWARELTTGDDQQQLRALALQCNHPATENFIRTTLLGDAKTYSDGKVQEGVEAPDRNTRSGAGTRLLESLEGGNVMERLIDLDERLRISLGHDEGSAKAICDAILHTEYPRAADLLDLSFQLTIKLAPSGAADRIGNHLVSYLRGRPPAEESAALAQPALVQLAATNVSSNLLVVFPSLTQPAVLARTVKQTPALLELLMKGSDPNLVMELVSREPVFSAAKPILENDPRLLDRLPAIKSMSKRGREAVERIDKSADLSNAVIDHSPDEEAAKEGRKFHRADSKATLVEAIDQLVKTHASSVSGLALLESHRAEVVPLLADGAHGPSVRALAKLIGLPPHVAMPYVGIQQLVDLPNSRAWFYQAPDATTLLHLLPVASRLHVAGNLTANTLGAREWLNRLPVGRDLTDAEERALDGLRPLVRSNEVLREIFRVRFGVVAPADYDLRTVDALYDAASRVPSAHLQQGRIERIFTGKMTDADAKWHGDSIEMKDSLKLGDTATQHPLAIWHTREEMAQLYGYDAAALTAQINAKRVETRVEKGVDQFKMKTQNPEKFTRVVLHEVGHAVDDMLGLKTEPVWGFAKWREYNSGEFDLWAAEMGGWNLVKEADKPKIRQAWVDAMRGQTSVRDLVAADHPAVSKEYAKAGVQVVDLALNKPFPAYYARVSVGDRVYTANDAYFGGFYSLQRDAAMSAPSHFSLYAPGEYFAECYAEYYGEVDGKPGSREKRGGGLPAPVKKWFDANVDTLAYDPKRFKEPA